MSTEDTRQTQPLGKRPRWPFILIVTLLAVFAVWKLAVYVLDAELYRPKAIKAIADATGLPTTMGRITLELTPVPRVYAHNIQIGDGDFRIILDSASAELRLRDLLFGTVTIPQVRLQGVKVTVPKDLAELRNDVKKLVARAKGAPHKSSLGGFAVAIGAIRASQVQVFRGAAATPMAVVNAEVRNPASSAATVSLKAALPMLGPSPRVSAQLTVNRQLSGRGVSGIRGTIRLDNLQLAELVGSPQAPKAALSAQVTVNGVNVNNIAFGVSGQVVPAPGEPAAVQAIAGPFTAKAWWQDGKFIINDLDWHAPGLTWTGDITCSTNGEIACNFPNVLFNQASLKPLLAMLPKSATRLNTDDGAVVEAHDLLMGRTSKGQFRFVKGTVAFSGLEVDRKDVTALRQVHGDLELKEGVIHVKKLSAQDLSLHGIIRPDLATRSVALDLSGKAELTRQRLSLFADLNAIQKLKATILLKRIVATVVPGEGLPRDLRIEGSLTNGTAEVKTAQFRDSFSSIQMDFASEADVVKTRASANSKKLGPIRCDGNYHFKTGTWDGALTIDMTRVATAFLKSDQQKQRILPLAQRYTEAPLDVTCVLPHDQKAPLTISIVRTDNPPLKGHIEFIAGPKGRVLGQVSASTTLPIAAFAHLLPTHVVASGNVPIVFSRSANDQTFTVRADLTQCSVAAGKYLAKKPGMDASIEVRGEAVPGNWTAQLLSFDLLGHTSRAKLAGGTVAFNRLNLDLSPMAVLLPAGAKLAGRITGTIQAPPLKLDLTLNNVAIALTPKLGLDSISGAISLADGQWQFRNVALRGANSDCVLNGSATPDGWRGTLQGGKLDLNAIQALADEAQSFTEKRESTKQTSPAKPFTGNLAVDVNSVFYRRARFDKVHANIQVQTDVTHIRNFRAQPYSGWITGAVDLVKAKDQTPAYVDLDLALDHVDARVLDALSTKEPRDFSGALTGKMRLRFPTGQGIDAINGASGTVRITGQDGSLGKMGLATKALAVLNATELIRLRIPSLRDNGLVFDTLACSLTMNRGFMTIEQFDLANPTLSAEAEGTIDFPRLATDVRIHIHPLEAVKGLVEELPVLRRAVNHVNKQGGLLLVAEGSPYDPTIRFEGTRATEAVTQEVKDASKKGGAALKNTVKKTAEDALNRLLGR